MTTLRRIIFSVILISVYSVGTSQNIFRFDYIGAEDGLSQNTAFSILFDSKGFMWIGTMNGLNRYDGYEFKIFRSNPGNPAIFSNNRIIKLWEDKRGFIWLETYDGYFHFFNPEKEVFHSLPSYEGNNLKNGAMKDFLQYSDDIILLGSSESGLYLLKYDETANNYTIKHLTYREPNSISGNQIKFIYSDQERNIWIGTSSGIEYISKEEAVKPVPLIIPKFSGYSFTSVCETDQKLWFGTEGSGILSIDKKSGHSGEITTTNTPGLLSDNISGIYSTRSGDIIAAFRDKGVMTADYRERKWKIVSFHSDNLDKVYEDRFGQVWLTAIDFGVTRLNPRTSETKSYVLTPEEIKPQTDLERPQFYEDSQNNLWIGVHGNGLGLYDRSKDSFKFYRNNPKDPNTISSNIIHCITEDKTGQLWVGTGQVLGGIEKVILENNAFRHILPEKDRIDVLDNLSRAMFEDRNRNFWVATKAGRIHLFDSTLKQIRVFNYLPGIGPSSFRSNIYSFFSDSRGYIWIGSKGSGLSVSKKPLGKGPNAYNDISFSQYEYSNDDSTSICNNNIYSIGEDQTGNIWVGTYGNGLSLIKKPYHGELKFIRINQQNSNLSSNLVRHLMFDSRGNLWISTTFGLNLLEKKDIEAGRYRFKIFLKNPSDSKSLIYNDVIHTFEDSKGRLWIGTFGGGVDLFEGMGDGNGSFRHYGHSSGAGYGIVYGILEDQSGNIWSSSENGLVCLNPENGNTEIFNNSNGLGLNSFSENTCYRREDGSLVFGGSLGFEVIDPQKLLRNHPEPGIELTKFLLFNKEVSIGQKGSPIEKSISFSEHLTLRYFQSSFSIDFSALNFHDPDKIQYAYKLENFEENWNNVGNQNRATYTNLSPGKYTFRVKSILQDGKSASHERILNIRIMPPWWKTTAAYISYLLLLGFISVLIYNSISRINRYKNALAIEKKVNEVKLQFFSNISHEIRTPLTMIIGPLEDMLKEDTLTNVKKLQMGIMLKNARRMLHLTNQLLDFRKVQNNKMVLRIREIDIVAFTKEIFDSFGPLARHKGITCSFESSFSSFNIFADPNKLDIIIYNIISNAIKFTGTGKHVQVKIGESQKNNSVDISISDEGPGIPQKDLSDIFTRYTILSNQDLAGTGIGLSLSYELAKLHNGDILISSIVGEGSTFTIRLIKGNNHLPENSEIDTREISTHTHRIENDYEIYDDIDDNENSLSLPDSSEKDLVLVVEDNHEILNYICQSLKPYFTCIMARNGEEGLHLARNMNPDVIITDLRMPGMGGLEMTKQLKDDFVTSHIPVIMLTAKSDMKDQIAGIETGAEAYIVKPFNMEYLKKVASNLINQRSRIVTYYLNNKTGEADNKRDEKSSIKVSSKDSEFLKKIVTFVEENYSRDMSVIAIADNCNVSRTVLYNKVKGLTGYSPVEFIRKMKLTLAAKLLDEGYNVSEAAYKTGFSDVKYFSRLFKAQFGYLPSKHKIEK